MVSHDTATQQGKITYSPGIGHSVTDMTGKSWQVVSTWSGVVVLGRESHECVVRDEGLKPFYQTSLTSWRMVTGAELELVHRQDSALIELRRLLRKDYRWADATYESKYRDVLARSIYDDFKSKVFRQQEEEKRQAALIELRRMLRKDFLQADEIYESQYRDVLARSIYDDLKGEIFQQQQEKKRQQEEEKRRREAEKKRQQEEEKWRREAEKRLREAEERLREAQEWKRKLRERKALIEQALSGALAESLAKADKLNNELNEEALVNYSQLKSDYLSMWLTERFHEQPVSAEQVVAIGELAHSFLLRARAGSGKTRVIANKAALIVGHERVLSDQLMILAFNRKAAKEATDRIRKELRIIDFNNARTFHSLAYQLVQPKFELLFDENTGSTRKQSQFVQDLLNSVLNPAILAEIYLFFREEMRELESIAAFMSKEDYYTYRRNHVQEALGGQTVKSKGEKWIADFLFEHNIRYAYEAIWYWDQDRERNYHPDFSLVTSGKCYDIVIEHWGIDLNDPHERVPDHWDQTWQEYRRQIDRKRTYWERFNAKNPDQQVLFLETSVSDLCDGRKAFEQRLAAMLNQAGVTLQRLSDEELLEKVVKSRIGRFSTMCLQYIQKAKKQRLAPEQMAEKMASEVDLDTRTKAFLKVANNLYRRYQQKLQTEGKVDFDDLMDSAIRKVHVTKGSCQIRIQGDRYVAMNELRWIMIDEYQDFSRLFYDLIDAIRTYNPSVRLFCVGDNWQAINAFAGSDLRYFDEFGQFIKDGKVGDLQKNYRSAETIVELGNHFMKGKGKESIATRHDLKGKVEVCITDMVWIEKRPGEKYARERKSDERFQSWIPSKNGKRQADPGMRIGKMLKQCHKILTQSDCDAKTQFAILSRVDRLSAAYPDLNAFKCKVKSTLTADELRAFGDFDGRVNCGTVHSYKGLEADAVIILGVNKRNFPKIHPDNELYSIFGVTPENVLAEEERLFYVAITRAKKHLYLFTETGRKSEFLDRLGLGEKHDPGSKYYDEI